VTIVALLVEGVQVFVPENTAVPAEFELRLTSVLPLTFEGLLN